MTCECCGREDIALPRCAVCQRDFGFGDDDKPDDDLGMGLLLADLFD